MMRIAVLGDDFNLNYLSFSAGGTASPTPTSAPTNTPTNTPSPTNTPVGPTPTPGTGTNLALNKPISASSSHALYPAANANDGSLTTYWEGTSNPSTLTVDLGANAKSRRSC